MKGSAEIILTDVDTGEVTRRHEKNLVTNAVQDLIRLNPAGLNTSGIPWGLPICPNAIGGVLLFGDSIEENASKYYAPTNFVPVGYASNSADTSLDPKRGSFNANESYRTDNGYRLVFDFSTSDANGTIKSVCLTSSDGGEAYFGSLYQSEPSWFKKVYAGSWEHTEGDLAKVYWTMGAIDDGHVYGASMTAGPYAIDWNVWEKHVTDLPLGQPKDIVKSTLKQTRLTTEKAYLNECWDGTDYYRWSMEDDGKTVRLARIRDGALTEWSMSWGDVLIEGGVTLGKATIAGGYLYALEKGGSAICRLNITDSSDIALIPIPEDCGEATGVIAISSPLNGDGPVYVSWTHSANGFVTNYAGLIHGDEMVRAEVYDYASGERKGAGVFGGALRIGPYALRTVSSLSLYYGLQLGVVTPYLATINNLLSPITKTPAQTMKIVYTLTEE